MMTERRNKSSAFEGNGDTTGNGNYVGLFLKISR